MKLITESPLNQSKSIRYLKAIALMAGPIVFTSGIIYYSYNRVSGLGIAQSEWNRFKSERNQYLDSQRAKEKAQEIKAAEESKRLQERAQNTIDYYADIPAVLQSTGGMTLVNFPKLLNGEPAQYSYKLKIGQQLYDVQGTITAANNSLSFEDNYSKTHESVMSAGEIRHEKDPSSGMLTLTFITSRNIGSLSNLGDIKIHRFQYK